MKTLLYFFIAIFICVTPVLSVQKTTKNVILHATEGNVSSVLMTQSAKVISARLKTYGIESSVTLNSDKSQIEVSLPNDVNVSDIEGLLTAKGNLGFYETLTLREIDDLSKKETGARPGEDRLGCYTSEDKHITDSLKNVLKSLSLSTDYKLLWGIMNSKSMTCIFAVKINPSLDNTDIEIIKSSKESKSQSITIEIKFKPASVKTWATTTKESLNKPISVVIDNKVFFDPVVKTPIEDGLCVITGNFTQKEVNYFVAIAGNGVIPVSLTLK